MSLSQYLLLALLTAGGIAPIESHAGGSRLIGTDALTQPNGGAMSDTYVGQQTPKKEDYTRYKKSKIAKTRRQSKGRHHSRRASETPKKDG